MTIEESVRRILTDRVVRKINFRFNRVTRVYGGGYGIIATKIAAGEIGVVREPRIGNKIGRYHYGENRLDLGLEVNLENVFHQSLVIHECTHALQDRHGRHLSVADSEGAAYLAQAYFLMLKGFSFNRISIATSDETHSPSAVLEMCYNTARHIHEAEYDVSQMYVDSIRQAIVRRGSLYADAQTRMERYNGIPGTAGTNHP